MTHENEQSNVVPPAVEDDEEESLIPEYIELSDAEAANITMIEDADYTDIVSVNAGCMKEVINKLVAHIEKQNEQIIKLVTGAK